MDTTTIIATLAILIAITLFAALVRQTMRAERLEAALERIEAVVSAATPPEAAQ